MKNYLLFSLILSLFFLSCNSSDEHQKREPLIINPHSNWKPTENFDLKYPKIVIANNAFDKEKYDSAIYYFNQAELEYGKMITIYNSRGLSYSRTNRFPEALKQFNMVIEGGTGHINSLNNRGMVYYKMKRYNKALKDFIKISIERPELFSVNVNIGNCYRELGMNNKACKSWKIAYENGYSHLNELKESLKKHCK